MMKLTVKPDRTPTLVLATVACGDEYAADWERYSLPSWERFASNYGYGVFALRESLLPPDVHPAWNKFLLPDVVTEELGPSVTTLVLDADQVFSPIAPPLEPELRDEAYGLTVEDHGPAAVDRRKLLSFLRRTRVDDSFPLDSIAVARESDWHTNPDLVDLGGRLPISSGFIAVPAALATDFAGLAKAARERDASWDGGGGDQTIASRELQKRSHYELDPRWQAIWPYLMAEQFPSLYHDAPVSRSRAAGALVDALHSAWCVHFATSWPEKEFWTIEWMDEWERRMTTEETEDLRRYLAASVTPRAYGRIAPPAVSLIQP
jgi:hypothetical protein